MTASAPCIVLAGGLGTRLKAVMADKPKCLAPVGRTVFLQIQLQMLRAQGIGEFILALGHMSDRVLTWLQENPQWSDVRAVVEPEPQGTGGAIAYAMDVYGLQEALVANGDTFLSGSLASMLAPLCADQQEVFRMALVQVRDRTRFGGVGVREDGRITGFIPKGSTTAGAINAGLYRLRRRCLPKKIDQSLSVESEVLPTLVEQGLVYGVPIEGAFTDIGVPEDYADFCARYG